MNRPPLPRCRTCYTPLHQTRVSLGCPKCGDEKMRVLHGGKEQWMSRREWEVARGEQ